MKKIIFILTLAITALNSFGQTITDYVDVNEIIIGDSSITGASGEGTMATTDWVLDQVGAVTSFTNMITEAGGTVKIGGSATEDTDILGAAFTVNWGTAGSKFYDLNVNVSNSYNVNSDGNVVWTSNGISLTWDGTNLILSSGDTVSNLSDVRALITANAPILPLNWVYTLNSSTTDSRPGIGLMRLNNATPASVTQIYLDDFDASGKDKSKKIQIADTNSIFYMQDYDDEDSYYLYKLTGGLTDAAAYTKYNVTYQDGSGSIPFEQVGANLLSLGGSSTSGASAGIRDTIAAYNVDSLIATLTDISDTAAELRAYTDAQITAIESSNLDTLRILNPNDAADTLMLVWSDVTSDFEVISNDALNIFGEDKIELNSNGTIENNTASLFVVDAASLVRFESAASSIRFMPNWNDVDTRTTYDFAGGLIRISNAANSTMISNDIDTLTFKNDTLEGETMTAIFEKVVTDTNNTNALSIGGGDILTSSDTISAVGLLEFKKDNIITVSQTTPAGDFSDIKSAIDSVNAFAPDSADRMVIMVYPGRYEVDNTTTLVFPSYSKMKTVGGIGSVVFVPTTSGDMFEFEDISGIDGVQIQDMSDGSAIIMSNAGNIIIENCIFQDMDTAITVDNPFAIVEVQNSFFANDIRDMKKGLNIINGTVNATAVKVANLDTVIIPFYITGENSSLNIQNCNSSSPNVDTFVVAKNKSTVSISATVVNSAKNGISVSDTAAVSSLPMTLFDIQNNFLIQKTGGVLKGVFTNNRNDEALSILSELEIGTPRFPVESTFGGGDSYSDDIYVFEYNGSTYTDVSDSARRDDGFSVEFPNTAVNSAIYIASNKGDSIVHHGLKLIKNSVIDLGTGAIVLEYFNGTSWVKLSSMMTEADPPFIPYAEAHFSILDDSQMRYNINVVNDSMRANDLPGVGADKIWVRYRITSPITTSPRIDQIKLHSSRYEINVDGSTENFGNSRSQQRINISAGDIDVYEGTTQTQTIYVDEDLGIRIPGNRYTSTSTKGGWCVRLPKNLDTSSPLSVEFTGRYVTGGSAEWTIRYKVVTPDSTLYTTEPAASGAVKTTVISQTVVAGDNEQFMADLDVSNAITRRSDGFGDQIYLSINPTVLPGNFDITNITIEYWATGDGGHY